MPLLAIGTLLAFGAGVWNPDLRLGLPVRFPPGPVGPRARAEAPTAHRVYLAAVCGPGGARAGGSILLGQRPLVLHLPAVPRRTLEAAVPYSVQQTLDAGGKTIVWPTAAKSSILAAFFLIAIFVWRPWCMLFCPLGAIFSLCNYVSFAFLRFQPSACHDCELLPRPVQVPRAGRTARERSALHPLPGMHPLPGPFHRHGAPAGRKGGLDAHTSPQRARDSPEARVSPKRKRGTGDALPSLAIHPRLRFGLVFCVLRRGQPRGNSLANASG